MSACSTISSGFDFRLLMPKSLQNEAYNASFLTYMEIDITPCTWVEIRVVIPTSTLVQKVTTLTISAVVTYETSKYIC